MILKTLLINLFFWAFFIAIIIYALIIGSNLDKTDEEKEMEDREQEEYIRNYKKRNGGIIDGKRWFR